jgi:PncC family amidohydrolase
MSAAAARRVAQLLKASGRRVAFAESCTGGLVSGALTAVPGISEFHCGGVVVYRNATKQAYLDIPADMLDDPGPVSRKVAEQMALRVLDRTPEADIAAAVTGHLGPGAPPALDGLVFVAVAWRDSTAKQQQPRAIVKELRCAKDASRVARQRWVVAQVLWFLAEQLEREP